MDTILARLEKITLPDLYTVYNGTQNLYNKLTWRDLFNEVRSKHWHCDSYNGIVFKCKHQESLFEHLTMCASICYTEAMSLGYPKPQKYYLAGLLHDIGKISTQFKNRAYIVDGKGYVSFKGHAIVGGALVESLCTQELLTAFNLSAQDWADISPVDDIHMCGYFSTISATSIHLKCFSYFSDPVKNLLTVLRKGDILGRRADPSHVVSYTNPASANVQAMFRAMIANKMYIPHVSVLIQIRGSKLSGKTTLLNAIEEYLINTLHIVPVVFYGNSNNIDETLQKGHVVLVEMNTERLLSRVTNAISICLWTYREAPYQETTGIVNKTLYNPFSSIIHWRDFTSITEEKNIVKATEKAWWKAHITLSVGWSGMKYPEIFNVLNGLLTY